MAFVDLCRLCGTDTLNIVRNAIFGGEGRVKKYALKISECLTLQVSAIFRHPIIRLNNSLQSLDGLRKPLPVVPSIICIFFNPGVWDLRRFICTPDGRTPVWRRWPLFKMAEQIDTIQYTLLDIHTHQCILWHNHNFKFQLLFYALL